MATFISRTVNLNAAGVAQQISQDTTGVLSITFLANDLNTGSMYVGDSTVSSDGPPLLPGRVMTVDPSKFIQNTGQSHTVPLSSFWIDGAVTDEDVIYFALLDI